MLPIPKAMNKIDVDLFLESGNCVHMQLRTGTEIKEYMDPGTSIEKKVKR